MNRNTYVIVRIDDAAKPTIVNYVGHADTPYDLNLRYTDLASSATQYSSKRDAIREATKLARAIPGYRWAVRTWHPSIETWMTIVWTSEEL